MGWLVSVEFSLVLAVSPSNISHPSPESYPSPDSDPLKCFISNLKAKYEDPGFFIESSGPYFQKLEFINLALVKKQAISEEDKVRDEFLKDTLHGSVEDIARKKEKIEKHGDIFRYNSRKAKKLILVEGSPGVGKTMLAMKICHDWAVREILCEYDLVILIPLRRFQTECKLEIEDLVRVYCGEGNFAKCVADILSKSGGDKTLLIFEGWDELHPSHRQELSLFLDIITSYRLPKASVMVTSRRTATEKLADYLHERHIEVLGFRPKQIEQYVQHNFEEKAESILQHLNNFPNLKALAHIPLTLSIICKVVKNEQHLPSTLTELYDKYICQVLFKAIKRDITSLIGINDRSELPDNIKAELNELCKVALHGLEKKRSVFTSSDLTLSISSSSDGRGLLNVHQVPAQKAGESLLYQFTHLSIQEFLAALQIQSLSLQECIQLLGEHREDQQFQNVWKFLSGITKLREKAFRDTIMSATKQANRSQLFLMHCLYEAHDKETCRVAAAELKWTLNLSNMNLNTTDCLCAAYTIVSAGGAWNVDLRNCNIGASGIEMFKQHMVTQQEEIACEQDEFSIKKFE